MRCNDGYGGLANDGCNNLNFQDKVCLAASRTLAVNVAEQIYFSNILISATGYLKILSAPAGAVITLSFLLNNTVVAIPGGIDPLAVNEAVAFTVVGFNEIVIASSVAGPVAFELSLTPRYTI